MFKGWLLGPTDPPSWHILIQFTGCAVQTPGPVSLSLQGPVSALLGSLCGEHVRAPCTFVLQIKARSSNQTPCSGSWKNMGKIAKQLGDFKKPEFLLGSGLYLEPEVSSLVGPQAGTLN